MGISDISASLNFKKLSEADAKKGRQKYENQVASGHFADHGFGGFSVGIGVNLITFPTVKAVHLTFAAISPKKFLICPGIMY